MVTRMAMSDDEQKADEKPRRKRVSRRVGAKLRIATNDESLPIVEALFGRDCPAAQCRIPAGFQLTPNGTWSTEMRVGDDGEPMLVPTKVAHAPLVVTARLRDIDDGRTQLELTWCERNAWQSLIRDRSDALDRSKITNLIDQDFPVDSSTATGASKYLAAFETLNRETIPEKRTTSHFGWLGELKEGGLPNDLHGFMWGSTLLSHAGEGDHSVELAVGNGAERDAHAYRSEGAYKDWLGVLSVATQYPRLMAGVYASILTPMLDVLGVPNFGVEYAGTTSRGKTTALMLAASVWGQPDQGRTDGSCVKSWNATPVALERAAQLVSGTPLFLDDTKTAPDREKAARFVYDVAAGVGKGRGEKSGGVQLTRRYRTVLVSTGEAPIVSFSRDGGLRTRIIEIVDPPLGEYSTETGKAVSRLRTGTSRHFGHMGPLFVRWMLDHSSKWKRWREDYQLVVFEHRLQAVGEQAERLSAYVSALAYAGEMLEQCIYDLGWMVPEVNILDLRNRLQDARYACIDQLLDSVRAQAAEAAPDVRALAYLQSWLVAHAQDFWGQRLQTNSGGESVSPVAPARGWAGRWKSDDDHVYVLPHVLDEMLEEAGFDSEAVRTAWREKGTFARGEGKNAQRRFRLLDGAARGYAFPLTVIVPQDAAPGASVGAN